MLDYYHFCALVRRGIERWLWLLEGVLAINIIAILMKIGWIWCRSARCVTGKMVVLLGKVRVSFALWMYFSQISLVQRV